jgi:hypothetical protein
VLGGGLAMFAAFVLTMECGLAARGYVPSLAESYGLWQAQRLRADRLGRRALILVGNSRMQNDIDLATLRRDTGLEPVQLAVGGASFLPVLEGLADDPGITGTVLVNFEASALALPAQEDLAYDYQTQYSRHGNTTDFFRAENWLSDELHYRLRSYADGTRPITALMRRVLGRQGSLQFESRAPDRQVRVDFARNPNPRHFAIIQASHELGLPFKYGLGDSDGYLRASMQRAIDASQPPETSLFQAAARHAAAMAAAIDARGGRVMFVVLPRSGQVQAVDDKRYPRRGFWDPFAASVPVAVHFADVPALQAFVCPDDSHLDERDQGRFTSALVTALNLGKTTAP